MCWSICIVVVCFFTLFIICKMYCRKTTLFIIKVLNFFVSAAGLFWVCWLACGVDIPAVAVGEGMCQFTSWASQDSVSGRRTDLTSCNFLTSTAKFARACLLACYYSKHCFPGIMVPWLKEHHLWFTVHLYFQVSFHPFLIGWGKYTWK